MTRLVHDVDAVAPAMTTESADLGNAERAERAESAELVDLPELTELTQLTELSEAGRHAAERAHRCCAHTHRQRALHATVRGRAGWC
jgi:hypothetical protein